MYQISSTLYLEVLNHLVGQIDNKGYYSGSFELDFDDIRCRMTLSAVIYRSHNIDAEHGESSIEDIIPVWWEFHTITANGDGEEILNDFSFNELTTYLEEV